MNIYQTYLDVHRPYARAGTKKSAVEKYGEAIDCFAVIGLPAISDILAWSAMRVVKELRVETKTSPVVCSFRNRVEHFTEIMTTSFQRGLHFGQ